jgi:hypothetical protein
VREEQINNDIGNATVSMGVPGKVNFRVCSCKYRHGNVRHIGFSSSGGRG